MRRASLQAGLFGGGLAVLLDLIGLLPYVGLCLALPLFPVVFFVTGLATVRVVEGEPDVGLAAFGGVGAGLLAGLIGGLAAMFLAPLRLSIAGGPQAVVQLLSPDLVQRLVERGLDPVAVMDFAAGVGAGMLGCTLQLGSAVVLAALGAALYAAWRRA